MADYDVWADYYDLIHNGLSGEAEFYVGQAVRLGGRTLELGCGTGRIAIPMAMSGVHVTGLDNSAAMLGVCREKLEQVGPLSGSLHLIQADMRQFRLDAAFDFIAMPYRAFMHLLDQQAQRECLSCVWDHLSDDGLFVLNVWVPRLIAQRDLERDGVLRFAGRYEVPDDDVALVHYCSVKHDWHRQLLLEEHVLHEVDRAGNVLSTQMLPLVRAWITPREMDNLVRLCGFRVEAVFGDFECQPFGERSGEMIWVLARA